MSTFEEFPKMARWSREVVISEKLDGTNAQVWISDDGNELRAGSRNRWLTYSDDNFGFAKWVLDHRDELLTLGPGRHFGEWWGAGIQRRYGLAEKRFSLFNTSRWGESRPACCHVVPVLYQGPNEPGLMETHIQTLAQFGSQAAPGFMDPEGLVMFHTAANACFKKTIKKDEVPKALAAKASAERAPLPGVKP